MLIAITITLVLYSVFVLTLIAGWRRSKAMALRFPSAGVHERTSVIIAARNEYDRIRHLLEDLSHQRYTFFEVIVVDDHSDDDTFHLVSRFAETDSRFRVIRASGHGKKAAITQAISVATGTLILTVDADCRVGQQWIDQMTKPFIQSSVMLCFGPVRMDGNRFFDHLQSHEFAAVIGTGAASWALGRPLFCNGANLAFRREAFLKVNGYHGNFHIPSGDDEFLMRKIQSQFGQAIIFVHHQEAIVTTTTNRTIRALIHQRIRWAGKWNAHAGILSKLTAVFVFAVQVATVSLLSLIVSGSPDTPIVITLLCIKMFSEAIFLILVTNFVKIRFRTTIFLSLQLLFPIYVCVVGVLCNFMDFEWKGRRITRLYPDLPDSTT